MNKRLLTKFVNRNPRNLEMLGLQAKFIGYELDLDRDKHSFIYKARLLRHSSCLEAQLVHFRDGVILSALSKEKTIGPQLYSKTDTAAALNLGRVLALRCLMSGIHFAIAEELKEDIERSQHLKAFYKAMKDEGITLKEIPHKEHTYITDRKFTYDRYEIQHDKKDKTDEL